MKRPLVVLSLAWVLGYFVHGWCRLPATAYLLAALVALVGGGWAYYQWRKGIFITLLLVGVCMAGGRIAWVEGHAVTALSPLIGASAESSRSLPVVGKVTSLPECDGDRLLFVLDVERLRVGGKWQHLPQREPVQVTVALSDPSQWRRATQIKPQQTVAMPLTFQRPPLPRNPGAFDYREYLARRGIHWLAEGKSLSDFRLLAVARYHPLYWMGEVRNWASETVKRMYPEQTSGVMRGILLGERKAVPERIEQDYATLGIIHVLSISGLHVSVLLAVGYRGLKRLGMTREKAAGVVMALLPLYVILTGMGAPVIRAALTAGMVLLATLLRRQQDVLSFLALSFLLQCGWNPHVLEEAGFQLTYVITAALVIGTGSLGDTLPLPWAWARQALAGTLIAQGVSLPFALVHFHEYSLLSGVANLLFVPIVSLVVTPLGMVSVLLAAVWETGARAVAEVVTLCLYIVDGGVGMLAQLTPLHRLWQTPPGWWLVVYALASWYLFAAWCGAFRFHSSAHRVYGWICWIGLLYIAANMKIGSDVTRITFLDVGQGDCAVVEAKSGQVIVIDGGGRDVREREASFDAGKQVVVPFLKFRGINQIDTLVMTHGDLDHIGGVKSIVERIPVKRVVRNPSPIQSPMEREVMTAIRRRGIPVQVPRLHRWERLGEGVNWQFYHPGISTRHERNEDSLVFLLTVDGVRFLFTGDAGSPTEDQLLHQVRLPDIHLLKVAHHGSRSGTQSKWLEALKPEHAVISAGRRNRYGHPAPEVIRRLQKERIHIWRTDLQGAIQVEVQTRRLRIAPVLQDGG
jgi:competence protein ComEC